MECACSTTEYLYRFLSCICGALVSRWSHRRKRCEPLEAGTWILTYLINCKVDEYAFTLSIAHARTLLHDALHLDCHPCTHEQDPEEFVARFNRGGSSKSLKEGHQMIYQTERNAVVSLLKLYTWYTQPVLSRSRNKRGPR
jgi:hypothetical protein